ncbi:hypothetical protein T4D_3070 [Trichinella pseudospiralis]|uniref:Uncharacterized protein n=1 Tax=Trichinella pseudospiralis TaxID=6337 RepID=A0A0V1FW09_TRIPS|nr:hypothetical protein T4D_3070 [Trichinella pseudospiralis]
MNRTCPKWFCPIDALSGNPPSELDTLEIFFFILHLVDYILKVAAVDIATSFIDFFLHCLQYSASFFFTITSGMLMLVNRASSVYASEEKDKFHINLKNQNDLNVWKKCIKSAVD